MSEAQILERLPSLNRQQRKEFIQRLSAREQVLTYEDFQKEISAASLQEVSPGYATVDLMEMVDAAYLLTLEEQTDLLDHACAQEEDMEVADFRNRHTALLEALHDPHPGYSLAQVRSYLQERRGHAASL